MSFLSQVIVETTDSSTNWTLNGWGWFALALVNAGLAEQKNRSRLAWFLSSLVLGPIATALIVMMSPAADDPVEPLHPFTKTEDGHFSLSAIFTILTLCLFLLAGLSNAWYWWSASVLGTVLTVVFAVLYHRSRTMSRAERRVASAAGAATADAEAETPPS